MTRLPASNLRSIVARLLLIALGILVALGVAEGLLTVANVAPPRQVGRPWGLRNEFYGWGYRPGATFTYDGRDEKFRAPSRINANGLREREYAYEKPSGVYRVLILGDSFTASLEVPLEQTWHEVLETELAKRPGPVKVEVIAAGVQGWSTDQQYLYYLHEGYKYQPDLVIVQFYPNDIYGNGLDVVRMTLVPSEIDKPFFVVENGRLMLTDPFRTGQESSAVPDTRSRLRQVKDVLRDHFRTYRLVSQAKQARARSRRPRVPFCYDYDGVPPELYTFAPQVPPQYRSAWDVTFRVLEALNVETARRNQRLAVVYLPDRRQVLPKEWDRTLACWPAAASLPWDLDKPNAALRTVLGNNGIPYLDFTAMFRLGAAEGRSFYFTTDWHLNPEGHRAVGLTLGAWLREQSLIPR